MAVITCFTATRANAVLTSTGVNVSNADTVTVGGKVYTFQTTLTNVDGNVLIGASTAASLANLAAAINLSAGAGTTYAAAMTANTMVGNAVATATTVTVYALLPGKVGGLIATTKVAVTLSWSGATLAAGTDGVGNAQADLVAFITLLRDRVQVNSHADTFVRQLLLELASTT